MASVQNMNNSLVTTLTRGKATAAAAATAASGSQGPDLVTVGAWQPPFIRQAVARHRRAHLARNTPAACLART
jgi:hypothetical protein